MFGLVASGVTLSLIAILILGYTKYKYTYWKRRNVPSLPPRIILGNTENPFTRKISYGAELKSLYDKLKSRGAKHAGIYSFLTPIYFPIDLEIIKTILVKDFNTFMNRGRTYNEELEPITAHLFNIDGEKWRRLRAKFTPTFTPGKMKRMFPVLLQCGKSLEEVLGNAYSSAEPVEVRELAERFTVDVIGLCVFGIECNSFSNPDSEFVKHGKLIFRSSLEEMARTLIMYSFPKLSRFLKLRRFDKRIYKFFMKIIKNAIEYRESTGIRRNDFLQILIDLKNNVGGVKDEGENLTIQELTAQAILFFVAGFETSAATISFCLYELASHPELQQRTRQEIRDVMSKHEGELSFQALQEMTYLQQVLDETLRKYPPLPFLNRQCVRNFTFAKDNITIEKKTKVIISILGLHRDPEYFPDPEKFDPDRFCPENRKQIRPFSYLPFGDGPRNCIGLRFGEMQTKTALCVSLKSHSFSLNPKTALPLEMNMSLVMAPKDGIWLDVTKLS